MLNTLHKGYKFLLKEVLPNLENYHDDIKVHDRALLKGYRGRFISACRPTGTHTVLLDCFELPSKWRKQTVEQLIDSNTEWMVAFINMNKRHFLIEEDGSGKEISLSEALALLEDRAKRIHEAYRRIKPLGIDLIAYDLYSRVHSSKRWKSALKQEWEDNSSSPSLTRLRNYFDQDILKHINNQSTQQEITQLLIEKRFESLMEVA